MAGTIDTSSCFLSTLNPFRYRAYVYDPETGLYCLGKRYYDPDAGRFISPDEPEMLDSRKFTLYERNLYAYCDNNPVKRKDLSGFFWETLWDLLSLGESVAAVIANPADPMNWVALVGDAIDVAIPYVGGIGEAAKASKIVSKADDLLQGKNIVLPLIKIIILSEIWQIESVQTW